ncbi:hypothetical protein BLS_008150 [Venturia inaequalis]|uniref:Transcription initiation factor TFIID subunit 1 histone acetyltransferase domain-containing protein n=1 Tax=Venturia inaequalis TaxID=5025 RepID=A0A8H3U7Q8_VENIN|nr:hypothetical protein BLS_008150 [Venturia inaequalis]
MASVALPPTHTMPLSLDVGAENMEEQWKLQEAADEAEMKEALAKMDQNPEYLEDIVKGVGNEALKADDAVDYEDFSDDELPEEVVLPAREIDGDTGMTGNDMMDHDDTADLFGDDPDDTAEPDFCDLFGDGPSSDPVVQEEAPPITNGYSGITLPPSRPSLPALKVQSPPQPISVFDIPSTQATVEDDVVDEEEEEDDDPESREQRELFARAARAREERMTSGINSQVPPPAPQTNAELFQTIWPFFKSEEVPRFRSLFPGKRANYLFKTPLKVPVKVHPTRANLELDHDQERAFKLVAAPTSRKRTNEEYNEHGVLFIQEDEAGQQSSEEEIEFDTLDDQETVGGVTIQDLRILCEDWDNLTEPDGEPVNAIAIETVDGWDQDGHPPSPKRRKLRETNIFESVIREDFPSFDDPERLTAKLAKHIPLDLNDSRLLIDTQPNLIPIKSRPAGVNRRGESNSTTSTAIHKKFNFSNDDEYDRLKEHSIRGAIGNITVEHSYPAIRLQWPFYKAKLNTREARSFHRPAMHFHPGALITVEKKLGFKKIKDLKKQTTAQIFRESGDLSLADNGSMMLLEYSEECPMMLSNFGMGNRLVNYYRRKDEKDRERPKLDIGETKVLLPNDQSPFAIFGFVDPGQTVPAIHNKMYRAPIFKHEARNTDFVVIRNQTGVHGTKYYLRNTDNLYVVGQEFPSVPVPGVHGRQVTSTAKHRLKMLAFRILHKNKKRNAKQPWCGNHEITKHYPGTDIPQNRTRMREIMAYNKEAQTWEPKTQADHRLMDMDYLRMEIQPEDVCLIDSMQVGHRALQDSGYGKGADSEADVGDNAAIDEKLAPWRASKNFLVACGDTAMIALHGEGDPTGRGEGFSFAKISMKGGFQAPGESVDSKIAAERKKTQTGHNYNVNDQKTAYRQTIRRIWSAQEQSLSSAVEPVLDMEMGGVDDQPEERMMPGATPRSVPPTPGFRPDDTASQMSFGRFSAHGGVNKGRILKITRRYKDKYGVEREEIELVEDSQVSQLYYKKKSEEEMAKKKIEDLSRTGDASTDALAQQMLQAELMRLEKNKERRLVREHQKSLKKQIGASGGAEGDASIKTPGQTQRKCANCGQHGHIKTNKKLCPLLNGKWPNGVPPQQTQVSTETVSTPIAETPEPSGTAESRNGSIVPGGAGSPGVAPSSFSF